MTEIDRNIQVPRVRVASFAALAALALTACGGGGGGSGSGTLPNQAPTASAKLVGEAVLQATTTFDSSASADADGSIAAKSWDYGDGTTGTADTHTYTAAGSYTATLTVTDNLGATGKATVAVTVAKCSADGLTLAAGSPQHAVVCMQTSRGELVIELFPTQAPVTVANFLKYVDDGFYAGTLIHRVTKVATSGIAVAQGGGYTTGLNAKTATYGPIVLESANGLSNVAYTLAMARTSVANSATSQFFINLVDDSVQLNRGTTAPGWDPNGYAVFGQLLATTQRQTTLDAIIATALVSDTPSPEVVIRSAVRVP